MRGFVAIILAGGSGQRFWPLSTPERPKQFLDLETTGRTLLQATFDRLTPVCGGPTGVYVVTGERYRELVEAQLPEVPVRQVLLEPLGRDTAAAIALATLEVRARHGDVTVGVFPADHRVDDPQAFADAVRRAAMLAETHGAIVTLGMRPDRPATGYGYIEVGEAVGDAPAPPLGHRVARFVEKPDLDTAQGYLDTGRFLWNAGIFVAPARVLTEELERYAPEVMLPLAAAHRDGRAAAIYPLLPKRSIDYAVMEHTDRACVVPAAFGWDDLGDWVALERLPRASGRPRTGSADEAVVANADHTAVEPPAGRNTVVGRHVGIDTEGSIIYNDGDGVIVTVGVRDVVVVRRGDAVLLVAKDQVQQLKRALEHPVLLDAPATPAPGADVPPDPSGDPAVVGPRFAGETAAAAAPPEAAPAWE